MLASDLHFQWYHRTINVSKTVIMIIQHSQIMSLTVLFQIKGRDSPLKVEQQNQYMTFLKEINTFTVYNYYKKLKCNITYICVLISIHLGQELCTKTYVTVHAHKQAHARSHTDTYTYTYMSTICWSSWHDSKPGYH